MERIEKIIEELIFILILKNVLSLELEKQIDLEHKVKRFELTKLTILISPFILKLLSFALS